MKTDKPKQPKKTDKIVLQADIDYYERKRHEKEMTYYRMFVQGDPEEESRYLYGMHS